MCSRRRWRIEEKLAGAVDLAIELSDLDAACVTTVSVFDQQSVAPKVARRGARHVHSQRQLGAGINSVGRHLDCTRHVTANVVAVRGHVYLDRSHRFQVVGSLTAFVPAM
jgi:hypothetical protein